MRTDEFFEALGELDDSLIINARNTPDNPVKIKLERRSWKPFAAAAACIAALVAVTALNVGKIADFVKSAKMNDGYPEDAVYQYTGDFTELELVKNTTSIDYSEYYAFDSIAELSELIISGTFVDNARQTEPVAGEMKGKLYANNNMGHGKSYNKFRVDRVFKGDINVGDEIIIGDEYVVNNGGLYHYPPALTPMINGDSWVYFLTRDNDGYYDALRCSRYPLPGEEHPFVLAPDNHGVYDAYDFDEKIYEDVKIMLGFVEGVQKIELDYPAESCEFTMPEFLGETFAVRRSDIYSVNTSRILINVPGIINVYLADLNGDSKREMVFECWNGASGLSASYIMVYDHANSKRYVIKEKFNKGAASARPEIRGGILYAVEYKTGANVDEVSAVPLTLDILTELEPEDELIAYDGETYKVVKSLYTEEGARIMIGLTKPEYEAGEYIKVLGVVENNTDKEISLYTSRMGVGTHTEISTVIRQDAIRLEEIIDGLFATPGWYTIVEPGEKYYQAMLFDTRVERLDDNDTLLPLLLATGNFDGTAYIHLLSDLRDVNSKKTEYVLEFDVSVVQRNEVEYPEENVYAVEEFDGYVELMFNRHKVRASDIQGEFDLFGGSGSYIENMYLIDLNGDGKREVCATVSYGSGIVDSRIMVYDLENRKLYELSDRGYYNYYLRVYRDSYGNVTPECEKYRYDNHELVSRKSYLKLDMMTEVSSQSGSVREPVTGASEFTEFGKSFTMSEFSGSTFYADAKTIKVTDKNGKEKELYSGTITRIFLYDLTGDGKREIMVDGITTPISGPGTPVSDPIQILTAIDVDGEYGWNMFPYQKECHFTILDNELYIVIGGEVQEFPLNYERFEELAKSGIMW